MEWGDEWLARDKLEHVLFCFSITIIFSLLASRTRYSFLRRRSIWFGSVVSPAAVAAVAAKEVADEIGFFMSAGASAKDAVVDILDAVVDILGIVLAVLLSLSKSFSVVKSEQRVQIRGLEIV